MTLTKHIDQLVKLHGSMRGAASVCGLDVSTLSRLRSGERGEQVGDDVLAKLGLERVVTLRRVKGR